MPRYFFDIHDGSTLPDDTGTELCDIHSARIEAAKLSGALLRDNPEQFWEGETWSVSVRDERGAVVIQLCFAASVVAPDVTK